MLFNEWDKNRNLKIISDFRAFNNSNQLRESWYTSLHLNMPK